MSDGPLDRPELKQKLARLYGYHEATEGLKPEGGAPATLPVREKAKNPGPRKQVDDQVD